MKIAGIQATISASENESPLTMNDIAISPTCPPPDPNPRQPRFRLPPLACDSHFHVFGPHEVFPFWPDRPFTPHDAPKEALFRLHEFLGFQRGVFVQSSCHGTDHAVLVDLLKRRWAATAASACSRRRRRPQR